MLWWFSWLIAGLSTTGLIALWFGSAVKELEQSKESVDNAIRQIQLHLESSSQVWESSYKAAALHSLRVSGDIYQEAVKNYEAVRCKPLNRLPAFLLGYRAIPKEILRKEVDE